MNRFEILAPDFKKLQIDRLISLTGMSSSDIRELLNIAGPTIYNSEPIPDGSLGMPILQIVYLLDIAYEAMGNDHPALLAWISSRKKALGGRSPLRACLDGRFEGALRAAKRLQP